MKKGKSLFKIFLIILWAFGNFGVGATVIAMHLFLVENPSPTSIAVLMIVMFGWIYIQLISFPILEKNEKRKTKT